MVQNKNMMVNALTTADKRFTINATLEVSLPANKLKTLPKNINNGAPGA